MGKLPHFYGSLPGNVKGNIPHRLVCWKAKVGICQVFSQCLIPGSDLGILAVLIIIIVSSLTLFQKTDVPVTLSK